MHNTPPSSPQLISLSPKAGTQERRKETEVYAIFCKYKLQSHFLYYRNLIQNAKHSWNKYPRAVVDAEIN